MIDQKGFRRALQRSAMLPIILAGIMGFVLVLQTQWMMRANKELNETYQSISATFRVQKMMVDQETALRGFLLAHDSTFLDPFWLADSTMEQAVHTLYIHLQNQPEQLAQLDSLLKPYWEWETSTKILIRNPGAARSLPPILRSQKDLMNHIRGVVSNMVRSQHLRATAITQRVDQLSKLVLGTIIALTLLVGFIIALNGRRQVRYLSGIYEQSIAESARQSELLRTTILSIGDGVIVTDPSGEITLMNHVAETLTGWHAAAAVGQTIADVFQLVTEGERSAVPNPVIRALREKKSIELDDNNLLLSHNGMEIPIADSVAPIQRKDGIVIGAVLVFRDVSLTRQAKRDIDRRGREFRALIENAPDLIVRFDRTLRIAYVNPAVQNVLGMTAQGLVGKSFRELGFTDATEILWEDMLHEMFEQGSSTVIETDVRTIRGLRKHQVRIVPEFNAEGDTDSILTIFRDITEYKRTEQRLRESEVRFRQVLENNISGFFLLHAERSGANIDDFSISFANEEATRLTSYSREELLAGRLRSMFDDDFGRYFFELCRQVFETGAPLEDESMNKSSLFEPDWLRLQVTKMDEGVAVSIADISVRRKLEKSLMQREEEFRALVENTPDVVLRLARDLTILYANPSAHSTFGSSKSILGNQLSALRLPETEARQIATAVTRTLKEGTITQFNLTHSLPSSECHFHGRAVPESTDSEAINSVIITLVDITERTIAERSLQDSQQRYRTLIENAAEAIFSIDVNGNFTYANPYILDLSGYRAEEVPSLNYIELVPDSHREMVKRHFFRQFLAKEQTTQIDSPFTTKGGSLRWLHVTSALKIESGEISGFDCLATSITEPDSAD